MLLSTNNYHKSEIESEPHNLLVDFSEDYLFDGVKISQKPVHVGLPYPIGNNVISATNKDPLSDILTKKKVYLEKLRIGRLRTSRNDVEEYSSGGSNYVTMPLALLELYNCKDPDPDWVNDSNVYYKGLLDIVEIDGKIYVIFYVVSDRKILLVDAENPFDTFLFPFSPESNVYSLKCYTGKSSLLLIKEKYKVTLIKITSVEEFSTAFQYVSNCAFIDTKINEYNNKHIGFLEKRKIYCKHVKSKKTVFKLDLLDLTKEYKEFRFFKKDQIILMDSFTVQIINYKKNSVLMMYDPELLKCNPLYSFKVLNETLFLVSQHYVIKVDLKDLEKKSLFSHTMEKSPMLVDLLEDDTNTYLCLASPFLDGKILFAGRSLFSLPYQVPGVGITLRETYLRNPDLLLIDNLKQTVTTAVVGLKLLNINDRVYIYFVTSLGCVYRQEISYEFSNNEEPCSILAAWTNKQKDSHEQPTLYITNFADQSDMFFLFNRPDTKTEKKDDNDSKNLERFLDKFNHVYTKKNIKSDLARGFLDIWEDSDSSGDERDDLNNEASEEPYYDKVNSWMDKIGGFDNFQQQEGEFEEDFNL